MKQLLFLLVILACFCSFNAATAQCLVDKDAGTEPGDWAYLDNAYNNPSPYKFGDMLGLNDAGQFQSIASGDNPLSLLTNKMRAFHAMDYDFNQGIGQGTRYSDLTKPKSSNGIPPFIASNGLNYDNFKNFQGMTDISSATEILWKDPLTWKEKIWNESDWWPANTGLSIPQGIRESYKNYTMAFIDQYAPANGPAVVTTYQAGNELWDYPYEEDYHAMLEGAYDAFVSKYGTNPANWKMELMSGSFQAGTRDNICFQGLRDFSNCGSGTEMYNQMGDYLNVSNCNILEGLRAINVHSYPFEPGSLDLVHPEKPGNEFLTFKGTVAFRDANPILANKGIWLTETGYDSYDIDNGSGYGVGVGELTHGAYLLRMYMLTSRYHLERIDLYMGFDLNTTANMYHGDTYSSSGLWELAPNYSAKPSDGAKPKPSWFSLMDFQTKFKDKVFTKAVAENNNVYAYILANPDGTEPYLVFWTPKDSDDNNLFSSNPVNQNISLPAGYKVATTSARFFSTTGNSTSYPWGPTAGNTFTGVSGTNVGSTTIVNARRMPAFIALSDDGPPGGDNYTDCSGTVINVTGGVITANVNASNINYVKVMNSSYGTVGMICSSWGNPKCNNNGTPSITVNPGTYIMQVAYTNSSNTCEITNVVVGTSCTDIDDDGVCADIDCDDNDASIPTTPGTSCNDNDPNTINDEIQGDGCTCQGEIVTTGPCAGGTVSSNANSISVSVSASNLSYVKIMTTSYGTVTFLCAAWQSPTCSNGLNRSYSLPQGNYHVQFAYTDGTTCEILDVTVGGTGCPVDQDNDGVCSTVDCDDNDASIPTTPGSACDDNDPTTVNDVIQADGCTCEGETSTGTTYTTCGSGVITATSSTIAVDITSTNVKYVKVMTTSWGTIDYLCASWEPQQCNNGFSRSIAVSPGTYYVQFSYESGSGTCEIYNVEVGNNANRSFQNSIDVYPNPSGGMVWIHENSIVDEAYSIKVFNVLGEQLLEENMEPQDYKKLLDLTGLTGGLYFIKLEFENGSSATKKVILEQ